MKNFQLYIKPYLKQYKWVIGLTILLGVLTFLTASMLTFTSGYLITRASEMPATILVLYVSIIGVRTFGIARPVIRYLERLASHDTVLKILAEMRVKLYKMLEPQALLIRSRFQTGDLLSTLAEDIEHLQDAYMRTIFPTVVALFLFLFSVVSLALFNWIFALWIALCLSLMVFVYPLWSLFFMKKSQILLKKQRNHLYQFLTDALFGIHDWIISGKQEKFFNEFFTVSHKSNEIEKKMAYWNLSRTFQLQVLSGIILIFVGVWAGYEAANGSILPTYIASFTLVTFPLLEGLVPTAQAVERIPTYQESLQRIDQIQPFPSVVEARGIQQGNLNQPFISIQNLSYIYANQKEAALKELSFNLPHGQKIAILGKSGTGKSTFLQLLIGDLQPSSGSIRLDGKMPSSFGDQIFEIISVLNQKPYLFATSVENNLRLGKADATTAELERVIQQVKLDRYMHSLPNGIHTQMEEAGQRFSGGERQRIALARILLKNTPVVILDEPMVGLDPLTEIDLLNTIFTTLQGKTVIMITHHLIGMEKMDQIIFLDKGSIVMSGTHQELMETNERYRQLYLCA